MLGQPFGLEDRAEALPAPHHNAQGAAIAVGLAALGDQREATGVEQVRQPARGGRAEPRLVRAGGMADLGCVDVGDADLGAAIPERVAIDDAGHARPIVTGGKATGLGVRAGGRGGGLGHGQGGKAKGDGAGKCAGDDAVHGGFSCGSVPLRTTQSPYSCDT